MTTLLAVSRPFTFPVGRAPGFDPTHIASTGISKGHGFSAIATVAGAVGGGSTTVGWISLLSGAAGVLIASPTVLTSTMDGALGPSATGTGTTANFGWTFAQPSAITDTACTIAAIIRPLGLTPTSNGSTLFSNTSGGNGIRLDVTNGSNSNPQFQFPNVAALTAATFNLAANVPYFVVGSVIANGAINYLAVNLNTGQVLTSTTTNASTPAAGNATYAVGNTSGSGSGNAIVGNMSAVMYSPKFMSMQHLSLWARDPWSFWFPRRGIGPDIWTELVGTHFVPLQQRVPIPYYDDWS